MEFCPLSPSFQAKIKSSLSCPSWLAADSTKPVGLCKALFAGGRHLRTQGRSSSWVCCDCSEAVPAAGPQDPCLPSLLFPLWKLLFALHSVDHTETVPAVLHTLHCRAPCCPLVLLALHNQPLTWAQNSGLPPCGQSSVMEPAGFRDFTARPLVLLN